jgi:UDP-N-acetylglucosamine 2-epimerase (non-hydrolysing)
LTAGATRLVGTDPVRIVREVCELLTNRDAYEAMQVDVNPYGDGKASERIIDLACRRFSRQNQLVMSR